MVKKILDTRGFSLLELLVAMAVMGVVAMAVDSLYLNNQRTAYTSNEVVNVQQNVRVALKSLSRDIRMAGFLVPSPTTPIGNAPTDLTAGNLVINTSSSAGKVARVAANFNSDPTNGNTVTVASADMAALFTQGDNVSIVRPADVSSALDTAQVSATPSGTTLSLDSFHLAQQIVNGDLIVFDPSGGPATTTITYALVDDPSSSDTAMKELTRNGHIVAQKITQVSFQYILADETTTTAPTSAQLSNIRAVQITVTGATDATKTGQAAYSGVKTRQMQTVVALRNY